MSIVKTILANIDDLRSELSRLQASLEDFKSFNAECWRYLATAAQLPATTEPAGAALPVEAPRVTNELVRRSAIEVKAEAKARTPDGSALPFAYLQFKVIEALQPHPGYESDDGFQPLGLILCMSFDEDRKAKRALAALRGAGLSLLDVVDDLVAREIAVKTGHEPCNGDVMIGLAENLARREAARLERRQLIGSIAARYSLLLHWNDDGTGSLITSAGHTIQPSGSVWTLLSCLYALTDSVANRPKTLN